MPKAAAPPLPATITSGQLGRLLGLSERAINARRLDGRLETREGGIDLAALLRAGLTAGRAAERQADVDREAFSFAVWSATCAAAAMLAPLPGETPEAAAARGLRRAMEPDDYFTPPPGWLWPDALDVAEAREIVANAGGER